MNKNSTDYGPAMMRAMENLLPQDKQLFDDPYSEKFLSPFYRFFVVLMRSPRMLNFMVKTRERLSPGIIGDSFALRAI